MIKLRTLLHEIYLDGFISSKKPSRFKKPENFDLYRQEGWSAYRGGNDWENGNTWAAIYFKENYEEMARVWFEIKFPPHMDEAAHSGNNGNENMTQMVREWGRKATQRWITEARKIRFASRTKIDPKNYRWSYRDWKECFIEALYSPRMKKFVKDWGVDRTNWSAMKPYHEEYGEDSSQTLNTKSQNTPTKTIEVVNKKECYRCHAPMEDASNGVNCVTSGICSKCRSEMDNMIKGIQFKSDIKLKGLR